MRKFLFFNLRVKHTILALSFFVLMLSARAQTPDPLVVQHGKCEYIYGPDVQLRETQVSFAGRQGIPNADRFVGYLEKLPQDYDQNPTKKYPLLIFIAGEVQMGNGYVNYFTNTNDPTRKVDSTGLCALFGPSHWTGFPNNMVENANIGQPIVFPETVVDPVSGNPFSFILITPQVKYLGLGDSAQLNKFLDYLESRYRVDPGRIYLSAISKGAGYVMDWMGNSVANSSRIAAAVLSSPCGGVSDPQARNIAAAHLPIWTLSCNQDDICPEQDNRTTWAKDFFWQMNGLTPTPSPKVWLDTFPYAGRDCKPLKHDTWGWIFDQSFTRPVNGDGQAELNVYQWMLQFDRTAAILPVTFTAFTARLSDKKVYLDWTVAQEKNNRVFTVERAGPDQQFTVLATIPSRGDVSTSRIYNTVDNNPLSDISYYRLSQTDANGKVTYYETRKVINTTSLSSNLIVSPNPFKQQFSVYVTLKKAQHLSFIINDIAGKKVQSTDGLYGAGSTEININASNLRPGIYFLRIEGEGISDVRKIVKN